MEIGNYNELRYIKKTDSGLILTDGEKEVILPYNHAPAEANIGDNLHVFVYVHADGRLFATTQTPLACVGDYAFLQVVDENENGAFLSLGIDKDVFVHQRDQKRPMKMGGKYVVYIFLDDNDRISGSSKVAEFVEVEDIDLEVADEVNLLIFDQSDLGFSAIVNQKYAGLLYHNEVFEELQPGDVKRGFVKKITEGNKIDLSLQVIGFKHILDLKESIMLDLKESGGILALGDKSSPDEIYTRLKISKKAFKKTIGSLYKERLVEISDFEVKLVKPPLDDEN
ncbi:CvfB family protein [Daejeonella oryzae]|uniref:CvfB family protein n=1 Tax=Daejeonella oryzae TaxID=1122943 RepID=UPI000421AEA2|nr:S1-like domain-containing RNA-binding protein [Daejeonella oryzae]